MYVQTEELLHYYQFNNTMMHIGFKMKSNNL